MLGFVFLNLVLFLGTYLAGCLPISFNFHPSKLRLLTVFGVGLLLGAALVIIIPEGVDSVYHGVHSTDSVASHSSAIDDAHGAVLQRQARDTAAKSPLMVGPAEVPALQDSNTAHHHAAGVSSLPFPYLNASQHIGLALLSGYVFMLLVDQLVEPALHSRGCALTLARLPACSVWWCRQHRRSTTVTMLNPAQQQQADDALPASGCVEGRRRITATLGFVIHSLADGLALGAAFSVNQIRLEVVLFLAIILHKVPAAFGLSCYLIHEGFSRPDIRRHLTVFSAASPIAGLLTYAYLTWSSIGAAASEASTKTGFALLLSGGTFLYVAASHVLPELIHSYPPSVSSSDFAYPAENTDTYSTNTMRSSDAAVVVVGGLPPSTQSSDRVKLITANSNSHSSIGCADLCVLLLGSVVPLLLTAGHSHG